MTKFPIFNSQFPNKKLMRLTLRSKNLVVTPALETYIESKLLKPLRRLLKKAVLQELPLLDLVISRSTRHHRKGKVYRAEANLKIGKNMLRAEVEHEDVRAACDLLEEELERQVSTCKNRSRAMNFRSARQFKKDLRLDRSARLFRKGRIRNEGN